MFYEFRQYTIKDGKRDEWVRFMNEEIIPFQISKGMVVAGSFTDEENENIYYWIRRFKSEEDRIKLYKAVYESDKWLNDLSPRVGEILDRSSIVVKRIVPTEKSVIQ
jgi:hypothetical protein